MGQFFSPKKTRVVKIPDFSHDFFFATFPYQGLKGASKICSSLRSNQSKTPIREIHHGTPNKIKQYKMKLTEYWGTLRNTIAT